MEDTIQEFRRTRDLHYESARRALEKVKSQVDALLGALSSPDGASINQTVGGAILNHQHWQDAERSLVRYWDAAGAVVMLERVLENAQLREAKRPKQRPPSAVPSSDRSAKKPERDPQVTVEDLVDEWVGAQDSVTDSAVAQAREEIQLARDYLASTAVWRVELTRAVGLLPRINWMETTETTEEDEVIATFQTRRYRSVRVESCRRVTLERDLREFALEQLAERGLGVPVGA